MAATGSVQYTNYKKITTAGAEIWDVYAYDFNGLPLRSVTIEVDTTLGVATLNLSTIAGLLGTTPYNLAGTKITIVALTGATNDVVINAGGSDTIGSVTTFSLSFDGSSAILSPVDSTNWAIVYTK